MPIEISGHDKAFAAFQRIKKDLRPIVVAKLATQGFKFALRHVDKRTKPGGTGQLRLSLRHVRENDNTHIIGHDDDIAPYAKWLHEGTKTRKVKPKRRKALRWAVGGKFFFSQGHMIKGIKADRWLNRTALRAENQLARIMREIDSSWP